MAELNFYSGTMDCGKSTLALQMDHTHRAAGPRRPGLHVPRPRRRGHASRAASGSRPRPSRSRPSCTSGTTSSTSSPTAGASTTSCATRRSSTPATTSTSSPRSSTSCRSTSSRSASSPTSAHALFEGSARLVELADRVHTLQVEALCWCGAARHPQRPHRERRDGHRGRGDRRRRRPRTTTVPAPVDRLRGAVPPPPPAPHDRRRARGRPHCRPTSCRLGRDRRARSEVGLP